VAGDTVTISGGGKITVNVATSELTSLTILSGEMDDNAGVTTDAFTFSGGLIKEASGILAGSLNMTGGTINADPLLGGGLNVTTSLNGTGTASWTGGVIGGSAVKGSFTCQQGLFFGQGITTLGWDMTLGYQASGTTSTYQGTSNTLTLTNDSVIKIERGGTLNLTVGTGGAGAISSGTSTVSYVDIEGTLEDKVIGTTGPSFTVPPLYVGTAGTLNVDAGAGANSAVLYVPNATGAGSPGTDGYSVYQNGGNVTLGLGGTGTGAGTLRGPHGFYQNAGNLNSTGAGGAFVGAAGAGNGLYILDHLILDPTQSTSLWGNMIVGGGAEVYFGASSTFDFCVNKAAGGSYSQLIVTGPVTVTAGATYVPHDLGTGTQSSWSGVINFNALGGGSWAAGSSNFTNPMGWTGSQNANGWDVTTP
jgi:hypothetical protein